MTDWLVAATKAGQVLDPMRHVSWYRAAMVVVWGGILLFTLWQLVQLRSARTRLGADD